MSLLFSRRRWLCRSAWTMAGVAGLSLTGCRREASAVRVGANVWPGYEPLFLAQELGFYGGGTVQLRRFPSATEVIRAYRNRAIDVAAVTADEALLLVETEPDQRIILVLDYSNGADAVLGRLGQKSVADLKGQRVGVESGALGAYFLSRALADAGMKPVDVTVVPVAVNEHERAFLSGEVDGLVTFEPVRSRLMEAGAVELFNSSRVQGEIVDLLLTRRDTTEAEPEALRMLVNGWFHSLEEIRRAPAEMARRMALQEKVTPQMFLASQQLLLWPDVEANRRLLSPPWLQLSTTLKGLAEVMVEHRLLTRAPDTGTLLDPRFLPPAR